LPLANLLESAQNRPAAIIASNDQMALGHARESRASLGLAVPQDLSLISFDNTPLVHLRSRH
jgi:LacI family transcriptional regulator